MNKTEELLANNAPVVDVRSQGEFVSGNASGSINIPLNEVMNRIEEFRQMKQPIILCCRTGNRSGTACSYLTDLGIDCYNAGSWQEVQEAMPYQREKE